MRKRSMYSLETSQIMGLGEESRSNQMWNLELLQLCRKPNEKGIAGQVLHELQHSLCFAAQVEQLFTIVKVTVFTRTREGWSKEVETAGPTRGTRPGMDL